MDLFGYRRIWFDIGTANESLAPIILSAGDHDGRIIAVRLWNGASSVSGTGLIARLLFNDNSGGSGGYVEMTALAGEATAAWEVAAPSEALRPGRSTLCIEISQGTTIVCSRLIEALVEPSVIDGDAPEAQDALAEFRAAVARLEDFTVPVVVGKGGTGKTSHTSNSVLTGNGTSAVKNVQTKSGALFATATNGAASFGTLPVAQGGTGATTVAAARAGLGLGNTDGALPIANGGTGATTVAAARSALGLGNTSGALPIANGGTGQTTISAARNALGLGNTDGALPIANGGTGQTTVAKARNALGLGNTSGALPVANGGTGSTDAAAARTALGITPANIGAAPNPIANNRLVLKDTSHTICTAHTGDTAGNASVELQDSAGTGFGRLTSNVDRNGDYKITLFATGKNSSGTTLFNTLQLGFDATRQTPSVFISSLAKPAWRSALDLAPVSDNGVANVTANSGYTFSEFKSVRFGPHVKIRLVFKATAAMAVDTNYAIGTIASDFRPPWETVLNLLSWNCSAAVTVSTNGVVNVRPLRQIPANTNIAITGDIIRTS